jgi:hypothetical protein
VNCASFTIAVAGFVLSAAATFYLRPQPRAAWLLGLTALFPAWLSAFLTLIDPASRSAVDIPLPPRALLSSGAALLGIIGTDYLLRKSAGAMKALNAWLIGVAALLPAWLTAALDSWR